MSKVYPYAVWPSQRLLAAELAISEQQVYRAVKDLIGAGLIKHCKVRPNPKKLGYIVSGYDLSPLFAALAEAGNQYKAWYDERAEKARQENAEDAERVRDAIAGKKRRTKSAAMLAVASMDY